MFRPAGLVLFVRSGKYVQLYSPSTNPLLKLKREEKSSVEGWLSARSKQGGDGLYSCYYAIVASLTSFAEEEGRESVSGFTQGMTR